MSEEQRLNPAERELEAALKSLAPADAPIDPIAAAFDAGQRSCRRQVRVWQSAAAAMILLGAGLWFVPATQQQAIAPHDLSDSAVAMQAPTRPSRSITDPNLLMLQAAVAERGLDALPAVKLGPGESVLVGQSIELRSQP